MSESLRVITLDNYDYNIIVNALNDQRLELVSKGESAEEISNVLLKLVDAPKKRTGLFNREER